MPTEQTPLSDQDGASASEQYTAVQTAKRPAAVKKQTPLPKMQLFAMMLVQFCEPVTGTVIYPFVVSLVNETGITGGDQTKTGYYAGIIATESVFFASEGLTAFAWGRASDVVGRRIPLAFGMLCLAASIASFGLSNKYWPLVVCRCIQGIMNGNIGISKSVIIDITDSTNIAQAFAFLPLTWGLGVVVGPMIGGTLSHPVEQWSSTLGKIEFLRQYPYALPCFTVALIPLAAFAITTLFFKEVSNEDASPDDDVAQSSSTLESQGPLPLRALMTRPILILLLNYAFLAWTEQACSVLLTLMYPTKIEYGGLSLSSFAIGVIMSFIGVMMGVSGLVMYPWLMARYSAKQVYRACYAGYLASPILFSLMNFIARRRGAVDAPVWVLIVIQTVTGAMSVQAFGVIMVLLSQATPARSMGAINGLAQTVACSMRMFAPFIASSLFSLSQENNLLGGRMVFLFLELLVISGCVAASRIEEVTKSEDE
ncbi:MFS general substrate transporter [Athelia psychrophila]|uniref:MFS general substrate transporter n=1 Tax=Athelia psychrophila TaxID=1759441 RepID=A0A166LH46_9AGAM|nr:MFS general substrate transporter [Fibularhizoctonia sp. CBS 109695]